MYLMLIRGIPIYYSKIINNMDKGEKDSKSHSGFAKSERDRYFQATLPLRGNILYLEKVRLDLIL